MTTLGERIRIDVQQNRGRDGSKQFNRLSPPILACIIGTSDFLLVLIAAGGAFATYYGILDRDLPVPGLHALTSFLAATLFVGGFERMGGYRISELAKLEWQVKRILFTWVFLLSLLLLVAFTGKISDIFSRAWMVVWFVAAIGMQLAGRCFLELVRQRWPQCGYLVRYTVIVGAGDEGRQVVAKLQGSRDKSIVVLGVFDDRKSRIPTTFSGVNVLGTTDDLLRFVSRVRIDDVIIALPLDAERRLQTLFDKLMARAVDLRLSVEVIADKFQIRGMGYIGGAPVLEIADRPLKHWRAATKWLEDKFLAMFLLIAFAPLMVIVALAIKLDSRGPVLFAQQRFGFNNEAIRVLKFRTMYIDQCDCSGGQRTMQHDPRITRVGRLIRALSIDELPQLFNVLRGEMSIVGPRPHPIAMTAGNDVLYGDAVTRYFHRHRVKPGITGWAQVSGLRGEIDTLSKAHSRVSHDLHYIEYWSLWFDLKILLKTIIVLLRQPAY